MTPELMAKLSGAAGLSPEDQSAMANMAADPMAMLRERLDPGMREIFDMMQTRKAQQASEAESIPSATPMPTIQPIRIEHRQRPTAETGRLRFLEMVNRATAGALGACPRCWGRDRACLQCDGFGLPGSVAPDQELFRALVMPALRAADAGQAAGHNPAPDHPAGGQRQSAPVPTGFSTDQPTGDNHV